MTLERKNLASHMIHYDFTFFAQRVVDFSSYPIL